MIRKVTISVKTNLSNIALKSRIKHALHSDSLSIVEVSSLRDELAFKALNGGLSCQSQEDYWSDNSLDKLVERCYNIADAFIRYKENKE